MNNAGIWDAPDLHGTLLRYWDEGHSCSQIALRINGEFGTRFTRNAIIGAVTRKGLPKRIRTTEARAPKKRERKPRPTPAVVIPMPKIKVPLDQKSLQHAISVVDHAIPLAQRRTIMELEDHHCRWPVGDPGTPEFFYCGADALLPLPYCRMHCRVAYDHSYVRVNGRAA